jgi:hypothetical protein
MTRTEKPFRRKRKANQTDRYLSNRQAALHPSNYDKGGNRKYITLKEK